MQFADAWPGQNEANESHKYMEKVLWHLCQWKDYEEIGKEMEGNCGDAGSKDGAPSLFLYSLLLPQLLHIGISLHTLSLSSYIFSIMWKCRTSSKHITLLCPIPYRITIFNFPFKCKLDKTWRSLEQEYVFVCDSVSSLLCKNLRLHLCLKYRYDFCKYTSNTL